MKAMRIVLLVLVVLTTVGCISIKGEIPEPPDIDIRVNDDGNSDPSILIDVGDNTDTSTLGAENGVLFYAYDALAYPQQQLTMTVRLVSSRTFEGLSGVSITFTQANYRVGAATTDSHGMARLAVEPTERGDYTFVATITDVPANVADDVLAVTPTRALLTARNVDDKFIVVSVDNVLVRPSLGNLLAGENILPMPGASDALSRLAEEKECTVIYLVDRSEQMNGRLKYWLSDHGFPAGPVLAMKPGASGRGGTTGLTDLWRAYPGLIMGIGGDIVSMRAFLDNGMTAFLLPDYQADPDEMRDLADDIEYLPNSTRLSVVNSWQEIEGVVFHDIRRSAEEYAERLERLADEIEKMQKHDQQDG